MLTHRSSVAVIGAGISGLICAGELSKNGFGVRVFEKARGPGGRMSTRRVPELEESADFDHGAQYFTARDPEFIRSLEHWIAEGVAAEWTGRIATIDASGMDLAPPTTHRFVGRPGMSSICRRLASSLDIRFNTRVRSIDRTSGGWILRDESGSDLGDYDVVLSTAPAPQSAALLREAAPGIASRADAAQMQPCWALLLSFDGPLPLEFDAAFVNEGRLSWVAKTSSKPGRVEAPERWVVHATPAWSRAHLEGRAESLIAPMAEAFFDAVGARHRSPTWAHAHRWRYALANHPLTEGYLLDHASGIGAFGDWTNGNRVEGAFLAGLRAARAITGAFHG